MPRGTNAPKLWPAEPVNVQPDRVVGQPVGAVPPGHLVAEHRADRAVDVADRQLERHRRRVLERLAALRDQLVVERLVEAVILRRTRACAARRVPTARLRGGSAEKSSPCAFQ